MQSCRETSYFIAKVTIIKHGRHFFFLKLRFNNKQMKGFSYLSIYKLSISNNPILFNIYRIKGNKIFIISLMLSCSSHSNHGVLIKNYEL